MSNDLLLSVDIGGTAVKTGIVDGSGNILVKAEYSTEVYGLPLMETALLASSDFLSSCSYLSSGIAISATGQIDAEKGKVIGSAGHIDNWVGSELSEAFHERFGIPVKVINDANAAALGEWKNSGSDDVIVMTIGTGIGGGIISGGRLLTGSRGIGGEIGHIIINADGEKCSCGNRGCLERYGSVSALVRRVTAVPELAERLGIINGKSIFNHLAEYPKLQNIVDSWISYIAAGAVSLIHVFDPEVLIIGGGVSGREEEFIKPVKAKIVSSLMPEFANGLDIRAASLGNDAGIIGAAEYFRNCEIIK